MLLLLTENIKNKFSYSICNDMERKHQWDGVISFSLFSGNKLTGMFQTKSEGIFITNIKDSCPTF